MLLDAGLLAVLQWEPALERLVTAQRIVLSPAGPQQHLLGRSLAVDLSGEAVLVSAAANRIALFFTARAAPGDEDSAAGALLNRGDARQSGYRTTTDGSAAGPLEEEPVVYVGPMCCALPASTGARCTAS